MSQSRIWNVVEESRHDEGNPFTRISFDNEKAALDFIEAVHRLEYEGYIQERANWGGETDGWVLDPGGKFLTRVMEDHRTGKPRTMRSYLPPKPVSYERWLAGEYTKILDRGIVIEHVFDQMHEPSKMRVETDWLYGHVPTLVRDSSMVRTAEEAAGLATLIDGLATLPASRRGMRRARRAAREAADAAST